jgi:hypothetical protein
MGKSPLSSAAAENLDRIFFMLNYSIKVEIKVSGYNTPPLLGGANLRLYKI